jgi:hypothetical protein
MEEVQRAFLENKLPQLAILRLLMLLDLAICTETFGNGVKMIGMKTMKAHLLMVVLGYQNQVIAKYYAVLLGLTILLSAVLRFAATPIARIVATLSVFVLCASPPGLHSLWLFCPLALGAKKQLKYIKTTFKQTVGVSW